MSSTKFLAIVPQTVKPGDKIQIKGKILPNAEEFSINFANETCHSPENITYHFKWILIDDLVVENYKRDGEWMDEIDTELTSFDGRFKSAVTVGRKIRLKHTNSITNGFDDTNHDTDDYSNSYSILGPDFALEFAFQDDGIYVYLVDGDGRNHITHYEPEFEISDIQSLQVWGDVDKINELKFSYA